MALLLAATLLLALASLAVGAGRIGVADTLHWLAQGLRSDDAHVSMVLGELRLPRVLKALAIGAALGASGVLLQAITRNPLAEPGLLGVNAGAALAVAIGLTLQASLNPAGIGPAALIGWALAGAGAGSALVLLLAHAGVRSRSPLRLVMAGLAVTATCHSLIAWLALARAATLDQFRFWLLGSLANPHAGLLAPALAAIGLGLLLAFLLLRPLAALGLGDDLAQALGHAPRATRAAAVVAVALMAGSAVALAGPIGFLGLIAPYAARAWVSTWAVVTLGRQLVCSVLIGAGLLLLADLAARLIVAPYEAPVSALLALLGAPLLILMVRRDALLSLSRIGADA